MNAVAMALASAALLGVVSTYSWSNVLDKGKLNGKPFRALHTVLLVLPAFLTASSFASELLEQKHQKEEQQEQQQLQEELQEQWGIAGRASAQVAHAAKRELEHLLRP